jgi:L-seryl-tRNA(Ser) seleniumtransferase
VDKTTLLALEATLRLYREPDRALREIPTLSMLSADRETLRARSEALAKDLSVKGIEAEVAEMSSVVGGGTFPGVELPSYGIRVRSEALGADRLASALRSGLPPLVARVEDESLWIDLRTVLDWQDTDVVRLLSDHTRP